MQYPTRTRPVVQPAAEAAPATPVGLALSTDTARPANVVISTLSGGTVGVGLLMSVVDLIAFDTALHRRILNGGGRIFRHAGVNIAGPRNAIVREFLADSTAEWLFMVDADMTFPPDTLERFLASADPVNAPIVGGLCFGADDGQMWPTMYELAEEDGQPYFLRWSNIPDNTMVQVSATGGACLLMHRDALKTIGDAYAGPYPWFQETALGGEPLGEDLTFCLRAGACGIPVYVHTGVKIGHVKSTVLNYEKYTAQKAADSMPKEQP